MRRMKGVFLTRFQDKSDENLPGKFASFDTIRIVKRIDVSSYDWN